MKTGASNQAIVPIQSTEVCDEAYATEVKPVNGWGVAVAI